MQVLSISGKLKRFFTLNSMHVLHQSGRYFHKSRWHIHLLSFFHTPTASPQASTSHTTLAIFLIEKPFINRQSEFSTKTRSGQQVGKCSQPGVSRGPRATPPPPPPRAGCPNKLFSLHQTAEWSRGRVKNTDISQHQSFLLSSSLCCGWDLLSPGTHDRRLVCFSGSKVTQIGQNHGDLTSLRQQGDHLVWPLHNNCKNQIAINWTSLLRFLHNMQVTNYRQ